MPPVSMEALTTISPFTRRREVKLTSQAQSPRPIGHFAAAAEVHFEGERLQSKRCPQQLSVKHSGAPSAVMRAPSQRSTAPLFESIHTSSAARPITALISTTPLG